MTIVTNPKILWGITIGQYASIVAGAVVTKNATNHALIYGNPASQHGWVCDCRYKFDFTYHCTACKKTIDLR